MKSMSRGKCRETVGKSSEIRKKWQVTKKIRHANKKYVKKLEYFIFKKHKKTKKKVEKENN